MKLFLKYISLLFQKIYDNCFLTILVFLSFVVTFLLFKNGANAFTVLTFELGVYKKLALFLSVLFDVSSAFSLLELILLLLIALLQSFIVILFYSYMKIRNEKLHAEKASILVTSLLAIFGASCAACGGLAFALFSSFGITALSSIFFNSSFILSAVVLLLLIILARTLKKVENPLVC